MGVSRSGHLLLVRSSRPTRGWADCKLLAGRPGGGCGAESSTIGTKHATGWLDFVLKSFAAPAAAAAANKGEGKLLLLLLLLPAPAPLLLFILVVSLLGRCAKQVFELQLANREPTTCCSLAGPSPRLPLLPQWPIYCLASRRALCSGPKTAPTVARRTGRRDLCPAPGPILGAALRNKWPPRRARARRPSLRAALDFKHLEGCCCC